MCHFTAQCIVTHNQGKTVVCLKLYYTTHIFSCRVLANYFKSVIKKFFNFSHQVNILFNYVYEYLNPSSSS